MRCEGGPYGSIFFYVNYSFDYRNRGNAIRYTCLS